MNTRISFLFACLLLASTAWSGENMIGRQSQNEGMLVLPTPGGVTVDGNLDDWDLSGRIWVFADKSVRDTYGAKVSAMWDANSLYLAIQWRDPTPAFSDVNPEFNPNDGWKSDALQLRIASGEMVQWLTTWHYAAQKQPVLHQAIWNNPRNVRDGGTTETLHVAKPGGTDLGNGAEMAYRVDEDGAGYVQEIKLPWTLVNGEKRQMAAGQAVRIGMEFLWGDVTGKTWPAHRYADNMQPGVTSREFYWTARHAWGDLRLVSEGNVTPRRYISDEATLAGTIEIPVSVPKDARAVSVVLYDKDGNRVRGFEGLDPQDYVKEETDESLELVIPWDGLADGVWGRDDQRRHVQNFELVEPGSYTARGIYHTGIVAHYDMTFYNPGEPAWYTADGSGSWGADHVPPQLVTRAGDWTIIAWPFAEGGSALIGVDPDGQKRWGEKRGAVQIAANADYLYAIHGVKHGRPPYVFLRLDAKTGLYKPFEKDGKEREFELKVTDYVGEEAEVTALATDATRLLMAASDGRLLSLDPATGEVSRSQTIGVISAMEFAGDGTLYGIVDGKLAVIDLAAGTATAIATPGLAELGDLAVDADGNLLVVDLGPDQQIKAYSAAGQLVYTIGDKGGRPIRGAWQPTGFRSLNSIAVDARDRVWSVEQYDFPRRVTVWNRDGSIHHDYVGGTGYAGSGTYLHDQDPTIAYCGPVEMRLDHETNSWETTEIIWVPDREQGETFTIPMHMNAVPHRFRAEINGQEHEYLFQIAYRNAEGYVLFMKRADGWKPVSAVTTVGEICGVLTHRGQPEDDSPLPGEWADNHWMDVAFWNDQNDDGKVQKSECEIVPVQLTNEKGQKIRRPDLPVPLGGGWSCHMADDLSFFVKGVTRFTPVRYTDSGAPIFTPASMKSLGSDISGGTMVSDRDNTVMALVGSSSPDWLYAFDMDTGAEKWRYANPYPHVHGSHRATMPKPGLLIGPLKMMGTVDCGEFGSIFAMRGNLGQDFYMTTDGIYIDSMFQDGRLPQLSLPDTDAELQDKPMNGYSNGGEPFNGWMARQNDGKVRMLNGMARQAGMIHEIRGLDSLTRFDLPAVTVGADILAKAAADNAARAAANAPEKATTYTISRPATAPTIDGDLKDWPSTEPMQITRVGAPDAAEVRLGYDDEYLYAAYTVTDPSPWRNEGKDFRRLFKTGDTVDLQISPTNNTGRDPKAGDLRVMIGQVGDSAVAVLMKPVDPDAPKDAAHTYISPVMPKAFDCVEILKDAKVSVKTSGKGYVVEAALPLKALGLTLQSGTLIRGDVGFTSSDDAGTVNVARTYWTNSNTNLVNDEPSEAALTPAEYGTFSID